MQFIKKQFTENFMNPNIFKYELASIYISSFFVEELRELLTQKERASYINHKYESSKLPAICSGSENVTCLEVLARSTVQPEKNQASVFQCKGVLRNLKAGHFFDGELMDKRDSFLDSNAGSFDYTLVDNNSGSRLSFKDTPVYDSDEVLIEREKHICTMSRKDTFSKEEKIKKALSEFRKAEEEARAKVAQWQKEIKNPISVINEMMAAGVSAARRSTAGDVSWMDANGYSYEEDDKTITNMLDTKDTKLPSPKSPGNFFTKVPQNKPKTSKKASSLKESTTGALEFELDHEGDAALFLQDEPRKTSKNLACRRIEEEMGRFDLKSGVFKLANSINEDADKQI